MFWYEQDAKAGNPMPTKMLLAEQAHYQAIAALTVRYLSGAITAEQAVKEKNLIDDEAREKISYEIYIKNSYDFNSDMIWAMEQYLNNPTTENAVEVVKVLTSKVKYSEFDRYLHSRDLWQDRNEEAMQTAE